MPGPLSGLRVVELSGIGPGPFAGMVLADLGAEVVCIDRPAEVAPRIASDPGRDRTSEVQTPRRDPLQRGRRSVIVDLRRGQGVEVVLRLAERSDVFVDPYRPGVAERLGIGPAECMSRNPALIYARITGWGQEGPYASHAGHDINYIALSGALEGCGRSDGPPMFAQNFVGDFGGGGMLLLVGILSALYERSRSGQGQTIDAAMVDGAALMTAFVRGMRANGAWPGPRGTNLLDGGCHIYEVYETADGKWISIGTIEAKFYETLLRLTGLDSDEELRTHQMDRSKWPDFKRRVAEVFLTRTRSEWCSLLEGESEICFAPVLDLDEAPRHPHNSHRGTFVDVGGLDQPAPAPRFSRTPADVPSPPPGYGADTAGVLGEAGFTAGEVERLMRERVVL
jgi:alpha-methylacyl-CoA racemase